MSHRAILFYNALMKILVVEDDLKINAFLVKGLKEAGFLVESVYDGQEAIDFLSIDKGIDLVILDIMLPKKSGLEVLQYVRANHSDLLVLVLSAKRSVTEKIEGFKFGADDYLEKPFSFSELLMRVYALLRRSKNNGIAAQTHLNFENLSLDLLARKVSREGNVIELQTKEFNLLEYFMRNPDRLLSKTMILENVYGYNFDTQTNVVDVLVCRLRNKIDKGFDEKLIHTIRGLGYVLRKDS